MNQAQPGKRSSGVTFTVTCQHKDGHYLTPQQQGSKSARLLFPSDIRGALFQAFEQTRDQTRKAQEANVRQKFIPTLFDQNSNELTQWRRAVANAAKLAMSELRIGKPFEVAVWISVHYAFPRPKGHWGTGKNAKKLKPSARNFPAVKPDLDKLNRAVFDAITGVVVKDDSLIVQEITSKAYINTPDAIPIAEICVQPLESES